MKRVDDPADEEQFGKAFTPPGPGQGMSLATYNQAYDTLILSSMLGPLDDLAPDGAHEEEDSDEPRPTEAQR